MNKALTLSIVIPAYNEENHLKTCLDSIACQEQMPDSVILVDNKSTDSTAQIAAAYPFVTVTTEPKQGIVYARNAGFDAAKGDIIGRIDADTILPKNWVKRIKKFYSYESNHDHAITGGGYFYNIRMPRLNGWLQSQLAYRVNRFVVGHYILWGSNMALTKAQWRTVRNDVCVRDDIHEDIDLAIHLHQAGFKITYRAKSLRVGVYLKRVWSDRDRLHAHMARWPQTLRVHNYRKWWMGSLGNLFLWYVVQPFFFFMEIFSRIVGRKSITKRTS